MAKLVWAISCHRVLTDKFTNTVTYVDSVEEFSIPNVPFPFPPVSIGTLWRRTADDEELLTRIRALDPDGKKVFDFSPDPTPRLTKTRHRLNFIIGGFPIHKIGEYVIVIDQRHASRWKRESSISIDVSLEEEPGTSSPE